MRYSLEPRGRIYVKGYGFMSFARSMSNKYGKKLVDTAKKSATDAIKTASKRTIQKTAEATGDSIDNKIADKITSRSKKSAKKLPTIMRMQNYLLIKKDTYHLKKGNKLIRSMNHINHLNLEREIGLK